MKKRNIQILLTVLLLALLVIVCTVTVGAATEQGQAGDINKDGAVNMKDVTRLFQHVAGREVEVDVKAIDTNGDGSVNMKDVTRLFQFVAGRDVEVFYEQEEEHQHVYSAWVKKDEQTHEKVCACGDVISASHAWDSGTITAAATHLAFGEKNYTCLDCGCTKIEQVDKLFEHTYGAWQKYNTEKHQKSCACGDVVYEGHIWDEGKVIQEPTETEEAKTQYTCTVCKETFTSSISKTPYTVRFYSGDELLDTQLVYHGQNATAPADPEKDGYRFDKWDTLLTNIVKNTDIHATFIKTYTVTFVDYDYSVLSSVILDEGASATAPSDPVRDGYLFQGWDKSYTTVISDMTVKAVYEKVYTVTFTDAQGNALKTYTNVKENTTIATLSDQPTVPKKEGYVGKWSDEATIVTKDTVIKPIYTIVRCAVSFRMPNGSIVATQTVEYGLLAVAPDAPEIYLDRDAGYKVYGFSRWEGDYLRVVGGYDAVTGAPTPNNPVVITAVYQEAFNTPVIDVYQYKKEGQQTSYSVTLCNLSGVQVYGIDLTLTYESDVGNLVVTDAVLSEAAKWLNYGSDKIYDLTYNNKTHTLRFAWSSGTSADITAFSTFIKTIVLEADDAAVSHLDVQCTLIVSPDGDKLTPAVYQ